MILTIAIDGPVGAGKSSVADAVAKELGILHLDTGAMYRALAFEALKEGISPEDEHAVAMLCERVMPEVRYEDGQQHTLIGDTDVTPLIRTPEISMAASTLSKHAPVRAAMVARQQAMAQRQSMLLDGRDIGTRVLPNATIKIYLTASDEVRAKRRFDELQAKGETCDFETVLADVRKRDEQDMTRAVDPLRPADDAQIVDTSDLSFEQVVRDIVIRVRLKQGIRPKPEEKLTPLYRLARVVAGFLFHTVMPATFHGLENAQLDAPFILISNHSCMLDPLAIGFSCYRYQIRFLGKKELVNNPITKWLFSGMRMIAVDRHNMDISALRSCLKVLKEGHPLGVFPEGTRHKQGVMEELESGIAMMALRSKVKLLPAYIDQKPKLFRRTHVYFGKPFSVNDLAEQGVNRDTCDAVLKRITDTYRQMIADAEKH